MLLLTPMSGSPRRGEVTNELSLKYLAVHRLRRGWGEEEEEEKKERKKTKTHKKQQPANVKVSATVGQALAMPLDGI